jgi:hypothetical protein
LPRNPSLSLSLALSLSLSLSLCFSPGRTRLFLPFPDQERGGKQDKHAEDADQVYDEDLDEGTGKGEWRQANEQAVVCVQQGDQVQERK